MIDTNGYNDKAWYLETGNELKKPLPATNELDNIAHQTTGYQTEHVIMNRINNIYLYK